MKNALAIRHVKIEHAGIFGEILSQKGFKINYLDISKGQLLTSGLESYSMLFILGGYMGAYETEKYPFLNYEFKIIEYALKANVPVIGLCLGAQILAKVLGFNVYKGSNGKEIGFFEIKKTQQHPFFSGFDANFKAFQWHGDTFDLPESLRIFSSEKYPNQGFIYNNTTGLQFHIEVTQDMVKEWLKEYADEINQEHLNPIEILSQASIELPKLKAYAVSMIKQILKEN